MADEQAAVAGVKSLASRKCRRVRSFTTTTSCSSSFTARGWTPFAERELAHQRVQPQPLLDQLLDQRATVKVARTCLPCPPEAKLDRPVKAAKLEGCWTGSLEIGDNGRNWPS